MGSSQRINYSVSPGGRGRRGVLRGKKDRDDRRKS